MKISDYIMNDIVNNDKLPMPNKPYQVAACWNYFNALRGYDASTFVLIGLGSIGKSFTLLKSIFKRVIYDNIKFVWFVENDVQLTMLNKHNGYNFTSRVIDDMRKTPKLAKHLDDHSFKDKPAFWVKSGIVFYGNELCGHILSVSEYPKLKGLNFIVDVVVFDEAIPEKITFQTVEYPKAYFSAKKSITRNDKVEFYIMANPIRTGGGILRALNLEHIKMGETIYHKDTGVAAHYIDTFSPRLRLFLKYMFSDKANVLELKSGNIYRLLGVPYTRSPVKVGGFSGFKAQYNIREGDVRYGVGYINGKLAVGGYDEGLKDYCLKRTNVRSGVNFNKAIKDAITNYVGRNQVLYENETYYESVLYSIGGV